MAKNGFWTKTDSSDVYQEIDMTSRTTSGSFPYLDYFKYKSIQAGLNALKVPYHTSNNPYKNCNVTVTLNNNYGQGLYFYYYNVPAQSNIDLGESISELQNRLNHFSQAGHLNITKEEKDSTYKVFLSEPKDSNFNFIDNGNLLDKIYYEINDPLGSYLWWNGGDFYYEHEPYMFCLITTWSGLVKNSWIGIIYECKELGLDSDGNTVEVDSWSIGQYLHNLSSDSVANNVPIQMGTLFDILAYEHWDSATRLEKASAENKNTYSINIRISKNYTDADFAKLTNWFNSNLSAGSKFLKTIEWNPGDSDKKLGELSNSQLEALMCGILWRSN